jgi:hypothetical protein
MLGVDYVFVVSEKDFHCFFVWQAVLTKKAKTNAARPELTTKTC